MSIKTKVLAATAVLTLAGGLSTVGTITDPLLYRTTGGTTARGHRSAP